MQLLVVHLDDLHIIDDDTSLQGPHKTADVSSIILNKLRVHIWRVQVWAGLKTRNKFQKKKYPLIVSDERVLASHLNLMTLISFLTIFSHILGRILIIAAARALS